MAIVSFGMGLYQDYTEIAVKDPGELYFCTDTQQIFLGEEEYTAQVKQFTEMPLTWEEGKVVQYVGQTDEDYTEGYFYQMTDDGWEQIDVQPAIRPIMITWAEYQQLSPEEIESNRYVITDYPDAEIDATDVTYNDTTVYNELTSVNGKLQWSSF